MSFDFDPKYTEQSPDEVRIEVGINWLKQPDLVQARAFLHNRPALFYFLPKQIAVKIGKKIDSGKFGVVYEYGNDECIKFNLIRRSEENAKQEDYGTVNEYFSFLGYIRDNKVKHVVDVRDWGILSTGVETIHPVNEQKYINMIVMTVMEKLQVLSPDEASFFFNGADEVMRVNHESPRERVEDFIKHYSNPIHLHDYAERNNIDKNHMKAILDFAKYFLNVERRIELPYGDLHDANVAFGKDGELKLIDLESLLQEISVVEEQKRPPRPPSTEITPDFISSLPKQITRNLGKRLGHGAFGVVYEFGKNKTIKFEIAQENRIDAYFSFLGYFRDNNVPHVAKTYDWGVLPNEEGKPIIYTVMEKMYPTKGVKKEEYNKFEKFIEKLEKQGFPHLDYGFTNFPHLGHGLTKRVDQQHNIMQDKAGQIKFIDHSGFMFGLIDDPEEEYFLSDKWSDSSWQSSLSEVETPGDPDRLAQLERAWDILNKHAGSSQDVNDMIKEHPALINYVLPKKLSKQIGKYLGGGVFGAAFEYGKESVIKVEFMSAKQSAQVDKLFSFLGFFRDSKQKHIAAVYDYGIIPLKKHIIEEAICVYIIMEKLRPLTDDEKYYYRKEIQPLVRTSEKENLGRVLKQQTNNYPPEIFDFMKFMYNAFDDFGHLDAHASNVAFGKDGHLKLIDHSGFLGGLGLGGWTSWSQQNVNRLEDEPGGTASLRKPKSKSYSDVGPSSKKLIQRALDEPDKPNDSEIERKKRIAAIEQWAKEHPRFSQKTTRQPQSTKQDRKR